MDLTAPARDIEELVAAFVDIEGTELAQMKELWRARSFSFIHEARTKDVSPSFYAQGLFSSALSHIVGGSSLSSKLGGLYVLYILHCTQQPEASYRIYLSLEELEALDALVTKIKEQQLAVAFKVVRTMFGENMFLFGSVSANQKRIASTVAKLVKQANSRVQQARSRVLTDVPLREHLQGHLGQDLRLTELSQLTEGYAAAKRRALCWDFEGGGRKSSINNGKEPMMEPSLGPDLMQDAEAWDSRRFELLTLMNQRQQQDDRARLSAAKTKGRNEQTDSQNLAEQQRKTITQYERELRGATESIDWERELVEELHRALDNDGIN